VGGFLGIGGSSAKTDRNQTLASYQQLNNLFNFGLSTGKTGVTTGTGTTAAGVGGLENSQAYWQKLMSGSRPALMQAAAPEINAVQSQGDAARRQAAASGTARGGGTAGANQQQKTDQMAQIDNALFGVRPTAAKESGVVSSQIANVGENQMQAALTALGIAGNAASTSGQLSADSRKTSFDINKQTQKDVTGAIQAAMMAFA
jgi:hypothetical protein